MIIPQVPAAGGLHYIWPGLQPSSDNFVFQDVGGDALGSGAWTFAEWTVDSQDNYNKTDDVAVYPGDSIDILFSLDVNSGEWLDQWTTTPGSDGTAAGEQFTAASFMAPESQLAAFGPLTQALFIIELQEGATWNFGPLTFSDITIQAQTTGTDWCSSPTQEDQFTFSMLTPVSTVDGNTATCTISSLVFIAPS
ncbi:hypothetical protein G7Y89_g1828 [Cudoniella acicularis]|uniref:Uncharacterized protein n=1 Tax=Cudoniella acicularis TaxID=354080 RepID=A0A8H4W972_9HELO|nr:hypothetical protein G7Y89_g1828 [Cudoniella acicularis]